MCLVCLIEIIEWQEVERKKELAERCRPLAAAEAERADWERRAFAAGEELAEVRRDRDDWKRFASIWMHKKLAVFGRGTATQENSMQDMVQEFMEATGGDPRQGQGPRIPHPSRRALLRRLIAEESAEVDEALRENDLPHMAKELTDLLYVTFFAANKHGIDLAPVFDEVHRSNMSKLDDDGKPIYDDHGKVMKGPNYSPADVAKVIAAQETAQ